MPDSYRIMVVDDEEDILAITKKSLERYGHVADTFSSSLDALEHFRKNPNLYDVVITDIRMPGIRGYELSQEMKKLNPTVKVFLMSAYEVWQSSDTTDPYSKIDDFLQKPFDRHMLCLTIRKHMSRAE
jgi:DNA-binding NtrC family response regulator